MNADVDRQECILDYFLDFLENNNDVFHLIRTPEYLNDCQHNNSHTRSLAMYLIDFLYLRNIQLIK